MLFKDGSFTIYDLEMHNGREWHTPSYDLFGYPVDWRRKDGFSACGDCWQTTGIHGTFSEDVGREALKAMRKKYPDMRLRLVRRLFVQDTVVVEE